MKSTRKSIVVMAVVLAVVFAVSSMAMARGCGRGLNRNCPVQGFEGQESRGTGFDCPRFGGMGFDGPSLRAVMDLNLSDSQRDQAIQIMETFQIDRIKTRGTMIKERDNLRTVLQADEFDEAKAREAFQKMSSIRENMLISKTKMMNEMKKILTPDQIKMLDERKAGRFGGEKGKRRMGQREAPGCIDQSKAAGSVDQNELTLNECSKDCSRW